MTMTLSLGLISGVASTNYSTGKKVATGTLIKLLLKKGTIVEMHWRKCGKQSWGTSDATIRAVHAKSADDSEATVDVKFDDGIQNNLPLSWIVTIYPECEFCGITHKFSERADLGFGCRAQAKKALKFLSTLSNPKLEDKEVQAAIKKGDQTFVNIDGKEGLRRSKAVMRKCLEEIKHRRDQQSVLALMLGVQGAIPGVAAEKHARTFLSSDVTLDDIEKTNTDSAATGSATAKTRRRAKHSHNQDEVISSSDSDSNSSDASSNGSDDATGTGTCGTEIRRRMMSHLQL